MSLTKADNIESIYNLDYSRHHPTSLFEATLEISKSTLQSGEYVLIKLIEQKRSKRSEWQSVISDQLNAFKYR